MFLLPSTAIDATAEGIDHDRGGVHGGDHDGADAKDREHEGVEAKGGKHDHGEAHGRGKGEHEGVEGKGGKRDDGEAHGHGKGEHEGVEAEGGKRDHGEEHARGKEREHEHEGKEEEAGERHGGEGARGGGGVRGGSQGAIRAEANSGGAERAIMPVSPSPVFAQALPSVVGKIVPAPQAGGAAPVGPSAQGQAVTPARSQITSVKKAAPVRRVLATTPTRKAAPAVKSARALPAAVHAKAPQRPKKLPFGGLMGVLATVIYGGKLLGAALASLGAALLLMATGKGLARFFGVDLKAILPGRRKS